MEGEYEIIIGLEVHVELATKSKIFCGCSTAFGGDANAHTCPVCTGMPGTLPVLNRKVVEYAIAVGLAVGCRISEYSRFDRKNYFYPDNPQNYQISQRYLPICTEGSITIEAPEGSKKIRITEIHMEEDAGKLIHEDTKKATLIDYNRAGVPLLEIVSEPDLRSPQEATAYIKKLRTVLQYLGVSDCKMQEGSLRADVNLSVRRAGEKNLGVRTEMKNLSSFRAIEKAVAEESRRQTGLLEAGKTVVQETRRWDEAKEMSYPMRNKEEAQDYRYFPEPDLVPLVIDRAWIDRIREKQPELCEEKRERYRREFALPEQTIRTLTDSKYLADLFEKTTAICNHPEKTANWLVGENLRLMREQKIEAEDLKFSPENLAGLIELLDQKKITGTAAKEVFEVMFLTNADPKQYAAEKNLAAVEARELLLPVIQEVLAANAKSAEDYKNGKEKAIGYLVGQTMKAMHGKANPESVIALLKESLFI